MFVREISVSADLLVLLGRVDAHDLAEVLEDMLRWAEEQAVG